MRSDYNISSTFYDNMVTDLYRKTQIVCMGF